MDWVISILLFIVALGLLITLHELGHFSMAKLFGVYCHEFSIGFGPALLHKRKEGKETYFSIRAIPVGGYVSMYGEEDAEIEPGLVIPKERSLEGIKKWKKAIILSAGIIVNALLAIVLFGVENLCFPQIAPTRNLVVAENSIAAQADIQTGDKIYYIQGEDFVDEEGYPVFQSFVYQFTDETGLIHAGSFFIVDNDVTINENHYVLTFDYYSSKAMNNFNEGIRLYLSATKEEVLDVNANPLLNQMYGEWAKKEGAPEHYPNFVKGLYTPSEETSFDADILVTRGDENVLTKQVTIKGNKNGGFEPIGLGVDITEYWLPFNVRFNKIWTDFGDSSIAVFQGLKTLFSKGGIQNMSGLVGIFTTSKTLYSTQTFATYLKFWGLISVNLAIFNLLPFPGLDGWQLLVTIIEGITRKKIPSKFKTVMTIIGFALLAILMVTVLVFDILRLV